MKLKSSIILSNILADLAILFLMIFVPASWAVELSLAPSATTVSRNQSISVAIKVDQAEGISGCALTLVYPESLVELKAMSPVATDFFQLLYDNRSGADPPYAYPWISNTENSGKVRHPHIIGL